MEQPNLKTVGIGKLAAEKIEAKDCQVVNVETEYVEKAKLNKAVFYIQHPAKEEPLKISTATLMRQRKDKKEIVTAATWVVLDKNKELAMDCALATVLKCYSAGNLSEMLNKTIKTEADSDGYLTIKAY